MRAHCPRAEKIRGLIENKLTLDLLDEEVKITISAGAAVYDSNQESIESVIIAADKALYQAKSQG